MIMIIVYIIIIICQHTSVNTSEWYVRCMSLSKNCALTNTVILEVNARIDILKMEF